MKKILVIAILALVNVANAQLSIQNDAYIYVTDEVIFVTDDVNIDDVNSKFYLRNEAQLIQGTGTTGNSGLGQLSIYQTGTVNQWSYNYWCSPVGNNSSAFGNESFRVNLIDDPLLSTPLDPIDSQDSAFTQGFDGSSSPLTISDRWLWTFVASDSYTGWLYAGSTGNVATGLGFTMKGTSGNPVVNQTYDFRGKPNNGTITNTVQDDVFTLVGNPYPSAMDAVAFLYDTNNSSNITGTLYYWEQDNSVESHVLQEYIGGYFEFTINSDGTNPSTTPAVFFTYDENDNTYTLPPPGQNGSKIARRYIPVGQGFMVEGTTSGTVRTTNAMRAYEKESGGNSFFFRSSLDDGEDNDDDEDEEEEIQYTEDGLNIVPDDYKRFRINVDFTVGTAEYTRQLLMNFHHTATEGFDYGLEASRSQNLNSDAYWILDEKPYSIQAYNYETSLQIPLVVTIEEQQPLRFRIFDVQNFSDAQPIYLFDIDNDVYVDLRAQDYAINIEPGTYTDRFKVIFTAPETLSNNDLDAEDFKVVQSNSKSLLEVINPNSINVNGISLIDISGKTVINRRFSDIQSNYQISTYALSDGVYIVNIVTEKGATLSKKVIVKN